MKLALFLIILFPLVAHFHFGSVVTERHKAKMESNCLVAKGDQGFDCFEKWDLNFSISNFSLPLNRDRTDELCKFFTASMNCMDDYAKECLKSEETSQMLRLRYQGAKATFDRICKNMITRTQFYRHADCFKKIQSDVEACDNLLAKRLDCLALRDVDLQICCEQRFFLRCVRKVMEFHNCDNKAMELVLEIANNTIRYPLGDFQRMFSPIECQSKEDQVCRKYEGRKVLIHFGELNSGKIISGLRVLTFGLLGVNFF